MAELLPSRILNKKENCPQRACRKVVGFYLHIGVRHAVHYPFAEGTKIMMMTLKSVCQLRQKDAQIMKEANMKWYTLEHRSR